MTNYVTNGGVMIVTCDAPNYDAVCSHFGYPITSKAYAQAVPTVAGAAHPIFTAPFGAVAPSITTFGDQGYFANTAGATVLGTETDNAGDAVIIEHNLGSGKVILLGDVDFIARQVSAGATITTDNDQFLGNLFNYAIASSNYHAQSIPSLSFYGLILLSGLLGLFGFKQNRKKAK